MAKKKGHHVKDSLIHGKGNYYGTTIGSSFWKRYKKDNLFMRGNGEVWLTRNALYFRRYLTLEPIKIPTKAIYKITMGRGHAGRMAFAPVFKIYWIKDDLELVSGFFISKRVEELIRWQNKFKKVTKARFL